MRLDSPNRSANYRTIGFSALIVASLFFLLSATGRFRGDTLTKTASSPIPSTVPATTSVAAAPKNTIRKISITKISPLPTPSSSHPPTLSTLNSQPVTVLTINQPVSPSQAPTATPTAAPSPSPTPQTDRSDPKPDAGEAQSSGVDGLVTITPTCPVAIYSITNAQNTNCPPQPLATTLLITNLVNGKATQLKSDNAGQFSLVLAPGKYNLEKYVDKNNNGQVIIPDSYPLCPTVTFSILPSQWLRDLILSCDSGIR